MKKKIKYALFSYSTENIGDEVQSIAARRFLPRVDYCIDRDNINSFRVPKNEEVKIIMNGWFLHPSKDGKRQWPPSNPNINPLLTSMHFSFVDGTLDEVLKPDSVKYLKEKGPIGTRDLATLKFLESHNIPTYFSGCLSLTLLPNPEVKRSDFVLAIDVNPKIIAEIKKRTSRPVIELSVYRPFEFNTIQKFSLAEFYLYLYQRAHCIVTSRLHVILPSLAFNTPVIALDSTEDIERYEGLINLANHYTIQEFLNNKSISIDNPQKNPSSFHSLRDQLIEICTNFTSYDSHQSYLGNRSIDDLLQNQELISTFLKSIRDDYIKQNTITSLNNEISQLKQEIIKLQKPLGIKSSTKSLGRAIKRACKVHFS